MKHGDSESGSCSISKGAGCILHQQILDEAVNLYERVRAGSFVVFVAFAAPFSIIASGAFLTVMDHDLCPADVVHVFLVIVIVDGDPLNSLPGMLAPSELVEPISVRVVVVLRVESGLQVFVPVDICVRGNEFVYRLAILITNLLIRIAYNFHLLIDLDLSLWMLSKVVMPQIVLQPL